MAEQAWWPDWKGKAIAIVASGPSTKKEEVALLKGRLPVLAIKENVDLAPWADVVYGCDAPFWENRRGLPEFKGLKISYGKKLPQKYRDIRIIEIDCKRDEILMDRVGQIGSGGNSGHQALNLAVQWGANRILLIGYDVGDRSGIHWYGRNVGQGRTNPTETNFRRWRIAYNRAAMQLSARDIDVVNASKISTLTCFRRAGVAETLAAWGV